MFINYINELNILSQFLTNTYCCIYHSIKASTIVAENKTKTYLLYLPLWRLLLESQRQRLCTGFPLHYCSHSLASLLMICEYELQATSLCHAWYSPAIFQEMSSVEGVSEFIQIRLSGNLSWCLEDLYIILHLMSLKSWFDLSN